MKGKFDEVTLSSYFDGELDVNAACRVSDYVNRDNTAQRFILDAVRSNALLRAAVKGYQDDDSSGRIIQSLDPGEPKQRKKKSMPIVLLTRIAAGLVIAFLAFGAGSMLDKHPDVQTEAMLPTIPASYMHVVENSLENDVSGVTRQWQNPESLVSITVTPIKTYRDSQGRYFRKYKLVVMEENQESQVIALAYRDAKKTWKTKSLTFVNGQGSA